jgi:hypothetical protein
LSDNKSRVRKKYLEKKMTRINEILGIIIFVGLFSSNFLPKIDGISVGGLVFWTTIIVVIGIFLDSELPIIREMRKLPRKRGEIL